MKTKNKQNPVATQPKTLQRNAQNSAAMQLRTTKCNYLKNKTNADHNPVSGHRFIRQLKDKRRKFRHKPQTLKTDKRRKNYSSS